MYFICREQQCGRNGQFVELTDEQVAAAGDEPRCPTCGSKDSCELATDLRSLLPESSAQSSGTSPVSGFVVKDSGKRQEFATGARRDTQDGKGDFSLLPMTWLHDLAKELQRLRDPMVRLDLVPPEMLCRLARVYGAGGIKYDENNYKKGINLSRSISSKQRHAIAWAEGDETEDHLAQEAWNCFTLMWTQEAVRRGELPPEIGDYGPLLNDPQHRTNKRTELSGADFNVPLREGVPCKLLKTDEARATSYVVVRRSGAVMMGWIPSEDLSPLTPAT